MLDVVLSAAELSFGNDNADEQVLWAIGQLCVSLPSQCLDRLDDVLHMVTPCASCRRCIAHSAWTGFSSFSTAPTGRGHPESWLLRSANYGSESRRYRVNARVGTSVICSVRANITSHRSIVALRSADDSCITRHGIERVAAALLRSAPRCAAGRCLTPSDGPRACCSVHARCSQPCPTLETCKPR